MYGVTLGLGIVTSVMMFCFFGALAQVEGVRINEVVTSGKFCRCIVYIVCEIVSQ